MKTKLLSIGLFAIVIFIVALFIGPTPISPININDTDKEILLYIRLPRVVVSILIGSALGVSGAILQGILRNPLADPYILGISSGAALVAATGLILGISLYGIVTIPLFAFIGAILTGVFVGIMGWKRGGFWPERLLLAGIGLGFLFSSMLMLIMSISSDEGLRRAIHWIFGDLSLSDWGIIPYASILIVAGCIISLSKTKALNALMLSDEITHSLGFSPRRERFILFVSVSLMTSASVSMGGTIGFIGLLIPHIGRFLIGPDNRRLIPVSAIGGAVLLCIADLIGKSLLSPMELPAGIITAIIGAPYFLYLLRRENVLNT